MRPHSHRVLKSLCLLLSCLVAQGARAETIPVITLTEAGPRERISTQASFYLKGTVTEKVDHLRVVFVRVKDWFWQNARSCEEVSKELDTSLKKSGERKSALFDKPAGLYEVRELWSPRSTRSEHQLVLLPSVPQLKTQALGSEYEVLVDNPSFFLPGSQACLFVISETEKSQVSTVLAKAVVDASEKYSGCMKPDPCEGKQPDSCKPNEVCVGRVLQNLDTTVKDSVPVDKQAELFTEVKNSGLWDIEWRSSGVPGALEDLSGVWLGSLKGVQSLPSTDGRLLQLSGSPPLLLLAQLLTQHRHLLVVPAANRALREKAGDPTLDFYTLKGLPVEFIGLTPDLNSIEFASTNERPPKGVREVLEQKLGSLSFSERTVSYLDVFQFLQGKVRWNGGFVPVESFFAEFKKFPPQPSAVTTVQLEQLREFNQWLSGMIGLFTAALDPNAPADLAQLRRWLEVSIRCTPFDGNKFINAINCPPPAGAGALPVDAMKDTPFFIVINALTDYLAGIENYPAQAQKVSVEIKQSQRNIQLGTSLRMEITRDSFFTYYVTPVTGYTYVPLTRAPFTDGWFHYLGIQLSFVPNLVDEPMWINGTQDWKRLFALEVGLGTTVQPFDDARNFRGPRLFSSHPVHVGAALRPLPYLSGTLGVVFLEQRGTPLKEERGLLVAAPAFSAAVQVNVPDIIRKVVGAGTFSSVGVFP